MEDGGCVSGGWRGRRLGESRRGGEGEGELMSLCWCGGGVYDVLSSAENGGGRGSGMEEEEEEEEKGLSNTGIEPRPYHSLLYLLSLSLSLSFHVLCLSFFI